MEQEGDWEGAERPCKGRQTAHPLGPVRQLFLCFNVALRPNHLDTPGVTYTFNQCQYVLGFGQPSLGLGFTS